MFNREDGPMLRAKRLNSWICGQQTNNVTLAHFCVDQREGVNYE